MIILAMVSIITASNNSFAMTPYLSPFTTLLASAQNLQTMIAIILRISIKEFEDWVMITRIKIIRVVR